MKKYIFLIVTNLIFNVAIGSPADSLQTNQVNVGIGLGLEYGGLGAKLTFLPVESVGIFAGLGTNFIGLGYNVGATYRILPHKRVCPYITGMYGYNIVLKVTNASEFNKAFYGPSFGGGVELHSRNNLKNYFNIAIEIPVVSQQYDDYVDDLKKNHGLQMTTTPLPFRISLGYHFGL